jgi:hypothetical protein
MRAPLTRASGAANLSSDVEGRGSGAVRSRGAGGNGDRTGPGADRVRIALDALRQRRRVGREESHGPHKRAAERALVAAMAGGPVLSGRGGIVDVRAKRSRVTEDGLQLGGDRGVVGASVRPRGGGRRGGSGEKLDEKREREDKSGQRGTKLRRARLCPTDAPFPFGAAAVHVDSPFRSERERRLDGSPSMGGAQFVRDVDSALTPEGSGRRQFDCRRRSARLRSQRWFPSGIKREHGAGRNADAVAAPATVSDETAPPTITGKLGRSASVVDPRARRPAIVRAAARVRGDR